MLALLTVLAAAWPPLPSPVGDGLGDKDAAVVIGVEDYLLLDDIPGAADAATDWYTWLVRGRGVKPERVHLLRNVDATRESALKAAQTAATQVEATGTVWIVFIGHGFPSPEGDGAARLLLVDTQGREDSVMARGIAQSELMAAATGAQARTVAVIDACFARQGLVPGMQSTLPLARRPPPGGTILFAASEVTAGQLPGHDRPAFSYLLLGALQGWGDSDRDGRVSATEAIVWTQHALTVSVRDRNQVPSKSGSAVDEILNGKGTAPALDVGEVLASLPSTSASRSTSTSTSRTTPPPGSTTAPKPAPMPVTDKVARRAFADREIRRSADNLWVRGDFATPLADQDLIDAGGAGAPTAAKTLDEFAFKETARPLVWVLAPVTGMVLGIAGGLVGAGIYGAQPGIDAGDASSAWLLGPFIGTFAGASLMAIGVGLPFDAWSTIDDDDKRRRVHAEADLVAAANAAERERLGLPLADVP